MATRPFEGLTPADDASHTEWITEALNQNPPGVAFRVPKGFEAIVRIHHPLHDDDRWAKVAPDLLLPGRPGHDVPPPIYDRVEVEEGSLGANVVDCLVPILDAATSTPDRCHFALWNGFGDMNKGSRMVVYTSASTRWGRWRHRRAQDAHQRRVDATSSVALEFVERCPIRRWWGGRDFWLFDGAIGGVRSIGSASTIREDRYSIARRSPQWWWPDDRSWFVATEIDDPWTYLAGSTDLIDTVAALDIETVRVAFDDAW